MNAQEIRDYQNWIGKSPLDVRRAAESLGGWPAVFRFGLPLSTYIHRVRNYFNVHPINLQVVTKREMDAALGRVTYYQGDRFLKVKRGWEDSSKPVDHKAATALTGLVLKDERNRYWYHMDPVGAAYHINEGKGDFLDIVEQIFTRSAVMKFISPDGRTLGSHEIIIEAAAERSIPAFYRGDNAVLKPFAPTIIADLSTQGSYNYGETVTAGGTLAHTLLDVMPHTVDKRYVSVPGLGAQAIENRIFPAMKP